MRAAGSSRTGRIIAVGVLAIAGAGVAVLLRGDDEPGLSQAGDISTTSVTSAPASTSSTGGPTVTSGGTGTSVTTASTMNAAAPWRAGKLATAPAPWLEAWGRAKNRRTCALLAPADAGANMAGAGATFDRVNGDAGWDVYLRRGPYVIEILGLFDAADAPRQGRDFEKKWPDGSVASYGPDSSGGGPQPEEGAFEAVLVVPGQSCGYRIYDSQGKDHLEFVLDHLRFVQGAP
jgi:hypothetical protein